MDQKQPIDQTAAPQKRPSFKELVTISFFKAWVDRAVDVLDQDIKTSACLERFVPLRDELVRRMTDQELRFSQCKELLTDTAFVLKTAACLVPEKQQATQKDGRTEVLLWLGLLDDAIDKDGKFDQDAIDELTATKK